MSTDDEPSKDQPPTDEIPERAPDQRNHNSDEAPREPDPPQRRARAVPRMPSFEIPPGYLREMDRIRDLIGPLDRFSAVADIGKLFAVTADVLPKIDPAWFSIGQMARDILGSPALTAALDSVAASGALAHLLAQPGWAQSVMGAQALLAEHRPLIMDFSARIEAIIPRFDGLFVLPEIGRSLALANEAWAVVARTTPDVPGTGSTWRLLGAGRTTLGVSATGLLLNPTDDEWDDDLLDEGDDELITGPAEARARLREELSRLDPRLVNRLDGAWERVRRHGPDAVSQAANSLVELLDWTLRRAAPEAAVLAWHSGEGRSEEELPGGRPTRALRIRFVVRARPDAAAAEMYVKGICELMGLLQGHKHGGGEQQLAALARLVPTVEAYLSFLLL